MSKQLSDDELDYMEVMYSRSEALRYEPNAEIFNKPEDDDVSNLEMDSNLTEEYHILKDYL